MKKLFISIITIGILIGFYAGVLSPWLVSQGTLSDEVLSSVHENDTAGNEFQYDFNNRSETGIIHNAYGLVSLAGHLATPWLSSWRTGWGTTELERDRYLPGDELIPAPNWSYTHAITINVPQPAVWPWLAQVGQNRGGFYSYQGLENLMGCEISNAVRPVREYQHRRPGDEVYLHPDMSPLTVSSLRNYYWLVLKGGDLAGAGETADDSETAITWTFYLQRIDNTTTRLITRGRYKYDDRRTSNLFYGTLLVEPINFVMERKMLIGIKERAEALWNARYGSKL